MKKRSHSLWWPSYIISLQSAFSVVNVSNQSLSSDAVCYSCNFCNCIKVAKPLNSSPFTPLFKTCPCWCLQKTLSVGRLLGCNYNYLADRDLFHFWSPVVLFSSLLSSLSLLTFFLSKVFWWETVFLLCVLQSQSMARASTCWPNASELVIIFQPFCTFYSLSRYCPSHIC